jgi:hypothetical protein
MCSVHVFLICRHEKFGLQNGVMLATGAGILPSCGILKVIFTVNKMTDFWDGAPSNFMVKGKAVPVTGRVGS